ncbi:sorbosone dehydrogenase family protein [Blastococcus sp. TF02A-26]|uniref:PQQ-dependent sugar dehydrogenase n=1 Tax=Blastococcus sp. TF02A-26 TaxID=2250577 RepID=UPI000DE8B6C0|nr:PQQ-dependent sugar dehydrogenase [Blastococcus sp. TF02A-26]RBY82287.1 PQQ-dependent sugar dehydrogenase [Blastococcus sp. TF02A-26]
MPPTARELAVGPCMGALLLLAACTADDASGGDRPDGAPALEVTVVLDGLDHPWDVAQAPDGTLVVDERSGGLTAVRPDGEVVEVAADFGDLYADGETGLMGLVLDPGFDDSRRLYTCQGVEDDGGAEIQVIAWTVAEDWRSATRVADPVVGGIPANEATGRHGGCRLRFDPEGALLVGTGDNAVGSYPQDRAVLGGKVLRVDASTGAPWPGNPFATAPDASPLVWTYGHRNVQGLAVRPGTGQVFAAEQGTGRDDEVTLLSPGANGGYDPDGDDGGYDESVPMTDLDLPDAVPATWASGDPTIATSGATFLAGPQWGTYDGLLVVGVQKDTGLLALRVGADGGLVEQFRVPELEDVHGRLRSPQLGSDGALYVTTDNGDDEDVLLRVAPA